MPATRSRRKTVFRSRAQQCSFCHEPVDEDCCTLYGEAVQAKTFVGHYFCMLFSCGLNQNGDPDEDSLRGFSEKDVLQELKRGSRLRCSYCKGYGATVGCSRKTCNRKFHLPCGMKRDCLFQYYDEFGAWCPDHRPRQNLVPSQNSTDATCLICMNSLDPRPSVNIILTPCCRQSLHRKCVQEQASSAGCHFFKCCHCANKESFQQEMLVCGIYIPEKDAAWEQEPNAYSDLLYVYKQCDAARCMCPKGKSYSKNNDPNWEVVRCHVCGSKGVHVACGNLRRDSADNHQWMCTECRAVVASVEQETAEEQEATEEEEAAEKPAPSVTPPPKERKIEYIIVSDDDEDGKDDEGNDDDDDEVTILAEYNPPKHLHRSVLASNF